MINLAEVNNINHLWGKLIIEELRRLGVVYFCISPGSRSSPLVFGVAENRQVDSCVHYDERGLAYHALGYASSTGKGACIIVTSGTAVGNCFPAVIEASKRKIPLIILTADRPAELRNTGANQTIDQVNIYGDYARFSFDMPCPSTEIYPQMLLTTIDQAVYRSKAGIPGPVHINCMFREPLVPSKNKDNLKSVLSFLKQWAKESAPFTNYISPAKNLSDGDLKRVLLEIKKINKGIVVAGKLKAGDERENVLKIAQKLNWPIFPDISSGLRLSGNDSRIIRYFDQILLDEDAARKYAPDGILHVGGRITSKRLYEFIEKSGVSRYIMVLNHPLRSDPLHRVTLRIESPVDKFCESIYGRIPECKDNTYVLSLKKVSDNISKSIGEFNTKRNLLTAPALIQSICELTFKKSGLFLASSMSIRLMDMFAGKNDNIFIIGSNRGASGIDGTLACAAGFAKGINGPSIVLLGDLAFLHDLNSLGLVKLCKHPFVIIVLNDDGGGMFSFLPVAEFPYVFEKYFAAPHGLNFKMAAKMFGITYVNPKSNKDFSGAYKNALKLNGPTIIEISLNRKDNLETISSLQKKILAEIR